MSVPFVEEDFSVVHRGSAMVSWYRYGEMERYLWILLSENISSDFFNKSVKQKDMHLQERMQSIYFLFIFTSWLLFAAWEGHEKMVQHRIRLEKGKERISILQTSSTALDKARAALQSSMG